MIKEE
jgi:DDE superfamily endonuclease